MALTDDQKTEIIIYLGHPARTVQAGTVEYSKILTDRLGSMPAYAESRVTKYMKKIKDIDQKIEEATERMSVTQVDDFKLNDKEVLQLRNVRKQYVREIGQILNIPVCGAASMGIRL